MFPSLIYPQTPIFPSEEIGFCLSDCQPKQNIYNQLEDLPSGNFTVCYGESTLKQPQNHQTKFMAHLPITSHNYTSNYLYFFGRSQMIFPSIHLKISNFPRGCPTKALQVLGFEALFESVLQIHGSSRTVVMQRRCKGLIQRGKRSRTCLI